MKKLNIDKFNKYIADGSILEFESPEECLKYFNIYDFQNLSSVEELKQLQGNYGFGLGERWYHINYEEALDVIEEEKEG